MVSSAAAGQRRHRPDGLDDVAAHVHAGIGELAAAVVHRRDDGRVREQQRARVRHRATLPDAADVRGRAACPLRRGRSSAPRRCPPPCRPRGPNAIMREAVAAFVQGFVAHVQPVGRCRSCSLLCAVVLAGCATRPINAPITEVNRNSGYRFQTRQLQRQRQGEPRHPGVLGRRDPRGGVLVRRARGAAAHRGRQFEGREGAPAGRGRRDHRRVGRQLHRARVRPVRRRAVRRLRGAVPQARRAGRAAVPVPEPEELVGAVVRRLGPVGDGRRDVRPAPVPWRDVPRPRPPRRAADRRHGDRHLHRLPARVHADRLRPHLLRRGLGAAVARRGGVVRRAARAVAGHAQQLRRDVRLEAARLGAGDARQRRAGAPGGTRAAADEGAGSLPGQHEPPVPAHGRRRPRRQSRHAQRARGVRGARGRALAGRGRPGSTRSSASS